MDALFTALERNSSIAAWKVVSTRRESCELFYVQKKTETIRATETVDYAVTVYVDKGEMRGQATFAVYSYMDEKQIEELIKENVFAASFALNPFYEIPGPEEYTEPKPSGNLMEKPFAETIAEIGKAIMAANVVENGSLSATEIFLYRDEKRIRNSKGVNVPFVTYECRIETIPNFVHGKEEVEIYQPLSFSVFDPKELTEKVAEALRLVKDRAEAVPMPHVGSLPVIIEEEEGLAMFFEEVVSDLGYQSAYTHSNLFELEQNIQEGGDADPLTVKLCPIVEGALESAPVDGDGVVLKPVTVFDKGVTKARHGSYQFGYYLGVEHPTGRIPVTVVETGTATEESVRKGPYLRCVRFSGMQADLANNFFGGEVRLGYYFDGTKEIPVTGLSIQGDYKAALQTMKLAKERITLEYYQGPKFVYVPNVKVH